MEIKKILAPCDFSSYAEHAFAWAVRLAQQSNAELVLVYAGRSWRVCRTRKCPSSSHK